MVGRDTGQARKRPPYKGKYKVGLGLCLAKFSKPGNLHDRVLTETDGTHVEAARGVAVSVCWGEKPHRSQCDSPLHKENGLV